VSKRNEVLDRKLLEPWSDYFARLYEALSPEDKKMVGPCDEPLVAVVKPGADVLIMVQIAKTHVKASALLPGGSPLSQ
jgi:hypothetical protein